MHNRVRPGMAFLGAPGLRTLPAARSTRLVRRDLKLRFRRDRVRCRPELGAELVCSEMAEVIKDAECLLPHSAGGVSVTGGMASVAEVSENLRLIKAVAELAEG
jgi:hypothetical protein